MSIFSELFIYILMCLIQTVPCFGHVGKTNLYKLWHRSRSKDEQTGRTGIFKKGNEGSDNCSRSVRSSSKKLTLRNLNNVF